MTLEDYCKKVTDTYLSDETSGLSQYENTNVYYESLDIGDRIEYVNDAYSTYTELKDYIVQDCYTDLMAMVKTDMQPEFSEYQIKLSKADAAKESELRDVEIRRSVRIRDAEEAVREKEASLLISMQTVINRHASIQRDKLAEIIRLYKLPVGKSKIDVSSMTFKELAECIDLAHYATETTVGDTLLTDKLISYVYYPITNKSLEDELSFYLKVSHFSVLVVLGYLLKPYFMCAVGFLYIVHFLGKLYKVHEREELLIAAYEISEPIDFSSFVVCDEDYKALKLHLERVSQEDDSVEILEIEQRYNTIKKEIEKSNPKYKLEEIQKEYNINFNDYLQNFERASNTIKDKHRMLLRMHEEHMAAIDRHFGVMRGNMRLLGTEVQRQKTMNTKFKIGSATYKDVIVAEATIDVPMSCINFLYTDDVAHTEVVNFAKLLLCNAICNVREKYLKVTIYDPCDLGKDFSEFLHPKLSEYISIQSTDFKKLEESMFTENQNNIAKFNGSDIQKYNSNAEAIGKMTADYHIVIIASAEEDLTKNKKLTAFMKYAGSYGVWVWNIMQKKFDFGESAEDKVDYNNFLKDVTLCEEAGVLKTNDGSLGGFDSPLKLYDYTPELGLKISNTLMDAIELNKFDVLPYETDYRIPNIPDDKIWTWSTLKGIELHLGLQDGDPSKNIAHVLGDNTVHFLMGGATGQGKSATINQFLATLLHMYSPEELELIMVDFKNIEFKMYTGDLLIPHAKIISGTKDGEYALSLFDYLLDEMNRRTRIFGEAKVQKLEEYNKLMKAVGEPEKCLPRILLIVDEFQVPFTECEPKVVEQLKDKITIAAKLARFAGLHMGFTSQSMKSTLPADILEQFKLRMALFCTKETSNDLIGNPAASTIKSIGWVYTNDSGAQNANSNRLFRIPFASNSYIKEYLPKLIKKCKDEGHVHRHARFYDEDELHTKEDLLSAYKENDKLRERQGVFLLGERTSYSTNTLPYGVTIKADDCEHVIVSCFEREALMNIGQTFIENCIQRGVDYCVHSADKDSTRLMDLENRVPSYYRLLITEPCTASDILELLDDMVQEREAEDKEGYEEFYFIGLNWEKMEGLGRNENYTLQTKLQLILQRAGNVNVHLILILRDSSNFRQLHLPYINHKIISKCSEKESGMLTDTTKGLKLSEKFAIHMYGSDMVKYKVYQFPLNGEIQSREVKI